VYIRILTHHGAALLSICCGPGYKGWQRLASSVYTGNSAVLIVYQQIRCFIQHCRSCW